MAHALTFKEILVSSRRGHTYTARVAYVGLGGILLYQFWTTIVARVSLAQASEYASFGRDLFRTFVPLQMLLVFLAALGSSAERIVQERRSGTLAILLSTPLGAGRIVWSKWKASVLHAGSLLLAGVPALALCVYLGLDPLDLLWSSALTFSLAMLGAAFGLRASAVAETVPKAILLGFGYFVAYSLLPLAIVLMGGFPVIFIAPFLHPLYTAPLLLLTPSGPSSGYAFSWATATLASFGIAYWVLGRAATVMVVRMQRGASLLPPAPLDPNIFQRWVKLGILTPHAELWEQHPVLWLSYVTRAAAVWTTMGRWSAAVYGFLFILLLWAFSQGRSLASFLFLASLFGALSLTAGATLFASEKEGRRLELLLSTPLSTARIVLSKLAAGVLGPEAFGVLNLALLVSLAFSWWEGPTGLFVYSGVMFVFLLGIYLLGAWASLRARSVQGAFLISGGLICGVLLLLPLLITLLAPPGARGAALPGPLYLLSCLNPVWVLEPLSLRPPSLALRHEAVARLLFFGSLWITGSLGLLASMVWGSDRRLGRR